LEPFSVQSTFKNNNGFTLFEVMVAITILAFISFSTYRMIDSNTDTKDRVTKEDSATVQTLTAIGRLDSDFTQMVNPLFSRSKLAPSAAATNDVYADAPSTANGSFDGKADNGELIPQFKSEDKSTIVFLTQANRRKMADSKESRFAWVKYSLSNMEADPENPDDKVSGLYSLVRQTISTDIYNTTLNWDEAKNQLVMDRIKSLEFSFWDERTKKFTTSLQELNENKNLIRSLKVVIVWMDADNNEQKIDKVFRVMYPYFNAKKDALNSGGTGAYGGGVAPPGTSDPSTPLQPGDGEVVQ